MLQINHVLHFQVSCIAATLALYIPYDFSFYREMPSLVSYALRYSAPLVALIVVPLAARIRSKTIAHLV